MPSSSAPTGLTTAAVAANRRPACSKTSPVATTSLWKGCPLWVIPCATCRPLRPWAARPGWCGPAKGCAPSKKAGCRQAPKFVTVSRPSLTNGSGRTDMAYVRALIYQIFLIVTVIPYAFACLIWAPLPLPIRYRLTVGWPRLAVWGAKVILGIRWQVKGWENLPDQSVVLLSKHQSAWETMFFAGYMPRNVCFVYKRELHRI